MATDKRERQRANRAEKQAASAKVDRRRKAWTIVKRYSIYALLGIAALLAFTFLFSN